LVVSLALKPVEPVPPVVPLPDCPYTINSELSPFVQSAALKLKIAKTTVMAAATAPVFKILLLIINPPE
jgi:hypothetical protein